MAAGYQIEPLDERTNRMRTKNGLHGRWRSWGCCCCSSTETRTALDRERVRVCRGWGVKGKVYKVSKNWVASEQELSVALK
jgi:hypothetical protein